MSKRLDSRYVVGVSPHLVKVKNRQHPAFTRVRDASMRAQP